MSSLNAENHIGFSPLQQCALVDLTGVPRVGFRGLDSAAYLLARGFVLPDVPNRAVTQADGSHVARLSQTEFLVLGSLQDRGERIADEEARWEMDHSANYLLPREDSHGWLQLSGVFVAEVMAKLGAGVRLNSDDREKIRVHLEEDARLADAVVNLHQGRD